MRGFAEIIGDMNSGRDYRELGEELTNLVKHVQEHGAGGSLTLEVTIKPNGRNSIKAATKITTKLPKPKRPEAHFYVAGEGDLVRDDPTQPRLPLRSVPEPEAQALKTV